jgi:alpha-tubulin suppressor-like RCC1 family protein
MSCGIDVAGAAWCWGLGHAGQLGNGVFARGTFTEPVAVQGGLRFERIDAGFFHTCGITVDRKAYCWGEGAGSKLGDGSAAQNRNTPAAVAGNIGFSEISAGRTHTCGIDTAGGAWCWGANDAGQIGDGTATTRAVPTRVAGGNTYRSISAGVAYTCAVTTSGTAWCWGSNAAGQLGNGTRTPAATPQPVAGGIRLRSITTALGIADNAWTCGVSEDSELVCWGSNSGCRFGNCAEQFVLAPMILGFGSGFSSVVATHNGPMCALRGAGEAFCWGSNFFGELGVGHTRRPLPDIGHDSGSSQPVSLGRSFTSIVAGSSHGCGITPGGAAQCWGAPGWGGLGNGEMQWSLVPRPVDGALSWR